LPTFSPHFSHALVFGGRERAAGVFSLLEGRKSALSGKRGGWFGAAWGWRLGFQAWLGGPASRAAEEIELASPRNGGQQRRAWKAAA